MIATLSSAREYLNQNSRVEAISDLHQQLSSSFGSFSQIRQVQWYDYGLEPAYLHNLFDQMVEEVSLLLSGLEMDDHELIIDRSYDDNPAKKNHHRSKTMTSLIDRYSILIDTLRVATQAAAESKDWALTNVCSDLAQRFDESLCDMAIYLNENWSER
jgi:DNA-binding ferritin-like protein